MEEGRRREKDGSGPGAVVCSSSGRSSPESTIKRTKKARRTERKRVRQPTKRQRKGKGHPVNVLNFIVDRDSVEAAKGKRKGMASAGDLSLCLFPFFLARSHSLSPSALLFLVCSRIVGGIIDAASRLASRRELRLSLSTV